MATEKTSLLHGHYILQEQNKVKEGVVVVTIPKPITSDDETPWSGLTRDQLMPYVNDPFWCALRRILLFVFWITLGAMLISAVIIANVELYGMECTPKVKLINIKDIPIAQPAVGLVNSLPFVDKTNLTSLAS